jgi:tRNA G18 (ribose-2'-O)-methylase SpoU
MNEKKLTLILWNIRSVYNVGAILRTAVGLGAKRVIYSGYTPNPAKGLPHERAKLADAIHKTALGAEEMIEWEYIEDIFAVVERMSEDEVPVWALEQMPGSVKLGSAESDELIDQMEELALILGEERFGVPEELLAVCDGALEIPMCDGKESFNVSVATGIACWEILRPRIAE